FMTLIIAKTCGARKATLIDYRTSADASGDYDRVVGYAGFIIE
ncbi:MAG: AmmeMemoRadiSam system protein B, partial [Candidatus Omnitrophica bacterium]|nr:AmmeMemoRadiSam system protein B [Candidatus Omnitrophota bacterium]